jgi:prepilin-type N-terminal cleavage/methylation domain-containing protein
MKYISNRNSQKGFTLIEILVVIAILAVLAAVVFAALNPVGRFQDSRNTTRRQSMQEVLTALKLFSVDHSGFQPCINGATGTPGNCGTGYSIVPLDAGNFTSGVPNCKPALPAATASCTSLSTLSTALTSTGTNGMYLSKIPTDPSDGSPYYVALTNDGMHYVVISVKMEAGTSGSSNVIYIQEF